MSPESEKETRRKRIDRQLDALGWPALEGHDVTAGPYRKIEIETASGPADYGLYLDGKLVGIVEAKKLALSPQNVLSQAERYSEGAHDADSSYGRFRVPFVYSSNGEIIWFRDVRDDLNRSRTVAAFHTPGGLAEALSRHPGEGHGWLTSHPSEHRRLRGYQHNACHAIEQAVMDHKRRMLVAMATGTGKTFTIVNEVYRLLASKAARRVLFLVDRRALAAQAVRAFAAFEPEPGMKFNKLYEVYSQRFFRNDLESQDGFDPTVLPEAYLTVPGPGHTFVYVTTIQRMAMNLFGKDAVLGAGAGVEGEAEQAAAQLDIPIHAFDVVIADECHRGYTSAELSLWRNTIDHFDAITIGLTATPASHSKAYFKDVVFRYDYETAVADGYLVDYDVLMFRSNVRVSGVFLKEGEEVATVDTTTGRMNFDLLEDERSYDSGEIERAVTVPDSNRKLLEELKRYTDEHEQRYGRFPKTLIFAANDLPHTSHADQVVDIARDVFGQGDAFVRKITGREDRPLQRIREFRNRPNPGIAVSVDLMSTGIDIPDLEFIVFMRPVKSRILFEQMLGRGTRLGEKHPDKSHFTVVDCFDGTLLEYFRNTTGITAVPPDKPTKPVTQLIEDIWDNSPLRFTTEHLQKAHRLRYDVALADLISMIKRAADTAAPLLTAERRVDAAMASVTAGRSFTAEQAQWLERIRNHLVQNLSVDTADFNVVPLFVRHGGLGRAHKVFGDDLESLLADLNGAVAA